MIKKIHGNTTYPFATLEIGDTFTVPAGRIISMLNALRLYNKKYPDKKVYINYDRSILTGDVEVFRTRRPIKK